MKAGGNEECDQTAHPLMKRVQSANTIRSDRSLKAVPLTSGKNGHSQNNVNYM